MSHQQMDKVLMPSSASSSKEKPLHLETSNDNNDFSVVDMTNSQDLGAGKEMTARGPDTETEEDDFFSVKGEFSRSCSMASSPGESISGVVFQSLEEKEGDSKEETHPSEEKKNPTDIFQDSFSKSSHTSLLEFLKDECWNEEITKTTANTTTTTSTPGKSKQQRLMSEQQHHNRSCIKHVNQAVAKHCCFLCSTPRRISKERRRD